MAVAVIFVMGFLGAAIALPSSGPTDPNCIAMTADNKAKLDTMMYEIIDFLAQLSVDNPDFDITSIKLKVERHYDGEADKDTEMEFTVNDCGADDELVTDDFNSYSVTTDDSDTDSYSIEPVSVAKAAVVAAQPLQEEKERSESPETPEVVWLQLPENGNEMMRYLKKRRGEKPFLMYMSNLRQFLLP